MNMAIFATISKHYLSGNGQANSCKETYHDRP